jgi:hypothetical protein
LASVIAYGRLLLSTVLLLASDPEATGQAFSERD